MSVVKLGDRAMSFAKADAPSAITGSSTYLRKLASAYRRGIRSDDHRIRARGIQRPTGTYESSSTMAMRSMVLLYDIVGNSLMLVVDSFVD